MNMSEDEFPNIYQPCAGLLVGTKSSATRIRLLLRLCEKYLRSIGKYMSDDF